MVSTEHLLTATEVARRCGLSLQGVTTAVARGHLPVAVKFGDRRLYHREDVDRWRQNVARQNHPRAQHRRRLEGAQRS